MNNIITSNWNGYKMITFDMSTTKGTVVFPKEHTANKKWALKTEYFDAFPDVQLHLLEKGYHLAAVENKTRWHLPEDTEAKAELAEYMHKELGLDQKCVIIGMSCGGMHGIYLAAKYPQYVSCMYLDAPVINLLSCPGDMGTGKSGFWDEFEQATGVTKSQLISYRNHPLDNIYKVAEKKIPIILICGDSDTVVPYEENGKLLKEIYEKYNAPIKTIIKPGCDHHPHGLEDSSEILNFIDHNYK